MGDMTIYEHHGILVAVDESLKGKHREHCLCFRCAFFAPNQQRNCEIAKRLFSLCKKFGLVTPVYECHRFGLGVADLSKLKDSKQKRVRSGL